MERRAFLRSLAAAVTVPALPMGAVAGPTVTPGLYARAVSFASGGAYFSAKFLSSSLGISPALGADLLARMKADGMIAEMGKSGLMAFKGLHAKHALMTAQAIKAAKTPEPAGNDEMLQSLRDRFFDVGDDATAPDLRADVTCDCDAHAPAQASPDFYH